MNVPGHPSGNWRWRFASGALRPELAERLRTYCAMYSRMR